MAATPRIASIGLRIWDRRVPAISFRSTQTLLDRDVVLLRLAGLQHNYRADFGNETFKGARAISDDDSPRFERDVERRRAELQDLLDRGGTLVLFLPAQDHWYVDTGERSYSGTGKNQKTTRHVAERKLLLVLPFRISTEAAISRDLELVGGDPFAAFWRTIGGNMESAAYLTSEFGTPTLRIKGTDAVVGAIAKVSSGTVIVLPQEYLYEDGDDDDEELEEERNDDEVELDEDVAFVDALLQLIREVRADEGDFGQPDWASAFVIPNEQAGRDAVSTAEERADAVLAEVAEAERALAQLQRRKTLITGTGKAFEILVAEALTALGCTVEEGEPGRTDRIAEHPTLGPAVVEAKARVRARLRRTPRSSRNGRRTISRRTASPRSRSSS